MRNVINLFYDLWKCGKLTPYSDYGIDYNYVLTILYSLYYNSV